MCPLMFNTGPLILNVCAKADFNAIPRLFNSMKYLVKCIVN